VAAGIKPTPTGLQHGGIVTQPTHALIGEAGPEAVVPLKHFLKRGMGAIMNLPGMSEKGHRMQPGEYAGGGIRGAEGFAVIPMLEKFRHLIDPQAALGQVLGGIESNPLSLLPSRGASLAKSIGESLFPPQQAGGLLNALLSGPGGAVGGGTITIDHKNAPQGVAASVAGSLFKNVTMKRQNMMAPAQSGPRMITAPTEIPFM
jgi:hypothetical protein